MTIQSKQWMLQICRILKIQKIQWMDAFITHFEDPTYAVDASLVEQDRFEISECSDVANKAIKKQRQQLVTQHKTKI